MTPLLRGRAGLALATLLAACSSSEANRPSPLAAASPTAAPKSALPYETPARWEVHPSPLTYATATMRLASGLCLVTDQIGQRWLTSRERPSPATPAPEPSFEGDPDETPSENADDTAFIAEPTTGCAGAGRAAADRAPEALVGIVRATSSYGFVGASGTVHLASSPLGKITRRISPPEPILHARAAGRTVLAVTRTGRLLRWNEDTGYERVDLAGATALDLAIAPAGHAVVLAAPEALFLTTDAGRTFTRAPAPSIGASRVGRAAGGPFIIEGLSTSLTWDPREPTRLVPGTERISEAFLPLSIDPGRSPGAQLVNDGRAALDGDQYWEIGLHDTDQWQLFKGKLGGPLTHQPLPVDLARDGNTFLAARGPHLAIALIGWEDGDQAIELRLSHDAGATFADPIQLRRSDLAPLGLAISAEGVALVTGACTIDEAAFSADCAGRALVLRPGADPAAPRGASPEGPAITPTFSPDGRSAYYLGSPDGDTHLALFVSRDAALTFEERPLQIQGDPDTTFEALTDTTVSVSENGTVGIVLRQLSGTDDDIRYVTTNPDGRDLRARPMPEGSEILGAFGDRALAVSRHVAVDDAPVPVWETLDRGVTWTPVPATLALRTSFRRRGDVACSAAGCLLGDDVTRIGWGGTTDPPLPFTKVLDRPPPNDLRTPIVCAPRPASTWTRIDHVAHPGLFPDERDAARGRTAWMLPTFDRATGAVGVVTATLPETGDADARIAPRTLLPPTPKGRTFALSVRPQIEGLAVARIELDPRDITPGGAAIPRGRRIKSLQLAWENLEEATSGRATLPDAGPLQPYLVYGIPSAGLTFAPAILSISPGGLFFRTSAEDATALFIDPAGKLKRFPFPLEPAHRLDGTLVAPNDTVHVDGTFIATSQITGASTGQPDLLVLFRPPPPGAKPDAPWTPWSTTLAPGTAYEELRTTRTDWTYDAGHLAIWSLHAVPAAGHATAWLARVLPDGTTTAPTRVPTPNDLPRTPRPCTADEHRTLPRLDIRLERYGRPTFPGARHPVILTELPDGAPAATATTATPRPAPIGRASLLSAGYVLRGTPTSPCVDAITATTTDDTPAAALLLGDLQHAWYFRRATPRPTPTRSPARPEDPAADASSHDLEVRPLVCHFDPTATVPASALEANANR